jgi:hypothetical protein
MPHATSWPLQERAKAGRRCGALPQPCSRVVKRRAASAPRKKAYDRDPCHKPSSLAIQRLLDLDLDDENYLHSEWEGEGVGGWGPPSARSAPSPDRSRYLRDTPAYPPAPSHLSMSYPSGVGLPQEAPSPPRPPEGGRGRGPASSASEYLSRVQSDLAVAREQIRTLREALDVKGGGGASS